MTRLADEADQQSRIANAFSQMDRSALELSPLPREPFPTYTSPEAPWKRSREGALKGESKPEADFLPALDLNHFSRFDPPHVIRMRAPTVPGIAAPMREQTAPLKLANRRPRFCSEMPATCAIVPYARIQRAGSERHEKLVGRPFCVWPAAGALVWVSEVQISPSPAGRPTLKQDSLTKSST